MRDLVEPHITVGILSAPEIRFCLEGGYFLADERVETDTEETITIENGRLLWNGSYYSGITFIPANNNASFFTLFNVVIGVKFHWERIEKQSFKGELSFIPFNDNILVINCITVEDYLKSVIASEMNGLAPAAFLEAHAVISRSWLLAQLARKNSSETTASTPERTRESLDEKVIIKWYDREEHTLFDVCADDHCQRYQGISRTLSPQVLEAIEDTRGEVLLYDGKVCDTRFSKCCGGITEEFQNCWQEELHPYMPSVFDVPVCRKVSENIEHEKFILSSPYAFCSDPSKEVLQQVLNDYDRETNDFYRWTVVYSQKEIEELLCNKTGIDFGEIESIIPLERGYSGRIIKLRIKGSLCSVVFGKELEIRRILSPSHLYSSAFVVKTVGKTTSGVPEKFILHGAGWGHGVGLCQIGAAVMGEKGYSCREILQHYYPSAILEKIYE